jgi:hypothetical protein
MALAEAMAMAMAEALASARARNIEFTLFRIAG